MSVSFERTTGFEPISLYNLCCVGLFSGSQVASKGDETNPPKGVWVIFGMKFPSRTLLGH